MSTLSKLSTLTIEDGMRGLTPAEYVDIAGAESKITPKLFKSESDPVYADMSSPLWSAVGGGVAGSVIGGLAGKYMAPASAANYMSGFGAGVGGILGATLAAVRRKQKNMQIVNQMRRLPPGATRSDLDRIYPENAIENAYYKSSALSTLGSGLSSLMRNKYLQSKLLGAGIGAGVSGAENEYAPYMQDQSKAIKALNLVLGTTAGAGLGGSAYLAKSNPAAAVTLSGSQIPGLVGKSLAVKGIGTASGLGEKAVREYSTGVQKALEASQAQERAAEAQERGAKATSKGLLASSAVVTAGILGALGYQAYKNRKEERKRKGQIKVTLPTGQTDAESVVDIPLAVLPEETYRNVLRDTRRRLRQESEQRKKTKSRAVDNISNSSIMYDNLTQPLF